MDTTLERFFTATILKLDVLTSTMRFAIVLTVLLACSGALAQNPVTTRSDVPKLEGLNDAQQRAVEEYVRQNERPRAFLLMM